MYRANGKEMFGILGARLIEVIELIVGNPKLVGSFLRPQNNSCKTKRFISKSVTARLGIPNMKEF